MGNAQEIYSYISDRKFLDPSDLVGYDFRPAIKELLGGSKETISPGSFSFGITINNLYIEGEGIRGVYSLNNIIPTEYGYKLSLMNARDPMLQGHLKIITNRFYQVEVLVFKRSRREDEIIFHLPELPKAKDNSESTYFTDRSELPINDPDSIWGIQILPFIKVDLEFGIQKRLQLLDSTSISFIEEIEVIEKEKKKEETEEEEEEDKKVKIKRSYLVRLKSLQEYEDGSKGYKTLDFPVKRIVEREDDEATASEERYQLEIVCPKHENMYLYLLGDRTVSSFEIGNKLYLMRGS